MEVRLLCLDVQGSRGVLFFCLMPDDLYLDLLVAEVVINQIVLLRLVLLVDLHRAVDEVNQVKCDGRASDQQGVQQSNEEAKSTSEAKNSKQDVDLAFNAVHKSIGAGMKPIAEYRQCAAKEDLECRDAELLCTEDEGSKQGVAAIDEELELKVNYLELRLVFDFQRAVHSSRKGKSNSRKRPVHHKNQQRRKETHLLRGGEAIHS